MKTKDNILKGKWVVRFDPAEYDYREILELSIDAAGDLIEKNHDREYREIIFDKILKESTYHSNDGEIPAQASVLPAHKIKNILLYQPYVMTDKRWQTIDLTASAVFLGSALKNNGYDVRVKKLQLPAPKIEDDISNYDCIGFTLFEELLPEAREFLAKLMENSMIPANLFYHEGHEGEPHPLTSTQPITGTAAAKRLNPRPRGGPAGGNKITAAGGPLVTLNPLQAVYHLPGIHLFVRGEAEFVLPGLLKALQAGDLTGMLAYEGFLFRQPGLLVISELGKINRPADFEAFDFNLSFLEKDHLKNGLEINFSRGCSRNCLFCSKVQGRGLRKLPLDKIDKLLAEFSAMLSRSGLPAKEQTYARCVNINDDDILQDPGYARQVFALNKKHEFKCWGIQTSLASFFVEKPSAAAAGEKPESPAVPAGESPASYPEQSEIHHELIELINDKDLFVNNQPLVWLGTDTFLLERGRRLGKGSATPAVDVNKRLSSQEELRCKTRFSSNNSLDGSATPAVDVTKHEKKISTNKRIEALVREFESRDILNYHYWISSDHESTWEEFAREFLFIHKLAMEFKTFGIIAHSPFVVPYCSTPLYRLLSKRAALKNNIKYRDILTAPREEFTLPLVERVETPFAHLNRLLRNESLSGRPGFFDSIKQKDYVNAFMTLYDYLKQERIVFESLKDRERAESLIRTEQEIERHISRLL